MICQISGAGSPLGHGCHFRSGDRSRCGIEGTESPPCSGVAPQPREHKTPGNDLQRPARCRRRNALERERGGSPPPSRSARRAVRLAAASAAAAATAAVTAAAVAVAARALLLALARRCVLRPLDQLLG